MWKSPLIAMALWLSVGCTGNPQATHESQRLLLEAETAIADALAVSALAAGTTYLVEIIYSDNRIVIPCKTRLLEFACTRRTPLTCENVSQTHSTGSSCSRRTTSAASS